MIQKQDFYSPIALRIYVSIFAILLGIGVTLFGIVPLMRYNCVWFNKRCESIQYQVGPSKMLLVKDVRSGFVYWYDGVQYIFAYGDNLSGSCPSITYSNVTGEWEPVGPTIDASTACRAYNNEGQCTDYYSDPTCAVNDVTTGDCIQYNPPPPPGSTYTAELMPGSTSNSSQTTFIPAFAVNASTMQLEPTPLCVRRVEELPEELLLAPTKTFQYVEPKGTVRSLDIYQIFDILKQRGIFQPPLLTTNIKNNL